MTKKRFSFGKVSKPMIGALIIFTIISGIILSENKSIPQKIVIHPLVTTTGITGDKDIDFKILLSKNDKYILEMKRDGNLVLKDLSKKTIWETGTQGKGIAPYKLTLQGDGNLVITDSTKTSIWATKTANTGKVPYTLTVQDNRNLVITDSTNKIIWETGTTILG